MDDYYAMIADLAKTHPSEKMREKFVLTVYHHEEIKRGNITPQRLREMAYEVIPDGSPIRNEDQPAVYISEEDAAKFRRQREIEMIADRRGGMGWAALAAKYGYRNKSNCRRDILRLLKNED